MFQKQRPDAVALIRIQHREGDLCGIRFLIWVRLSDVPPNTDESFATALIDHGGQADMRYKIRTRIAVQLRFRQIAFQSEKPEVDGLGTERLEVAR